MEKKKVADAKKVANKCANLVKGTLLANCDIHEMDLHGKDISGANFLNSNFSGANLSGANLSGAKGLD